MGKLSILSVFLFVGLVVCDDLLPKPCDVNDTECLNKSTETFLEKTAGGIPDFDVHPIDPLIIPLHVVSRDGVEVYLKNIEVKGLKHQKISNFKLDQALKSVVLTMKLNLTIGADIVVEVPNANKTEAKRYTGSYTGKASPLGTAKYGYSFFKDDKGVEHFLVGPETTTCSLDSEPQITFDADLEKALNNDPKVRDMREKDKKMMSTAFCKIVEIAYITVVHNIRASAKLLPKSAFFTNV